jgi:hypothetical protein
MLKSHLGVDRILSVFRQSHKSVSVLTTESKLHRCFVLTVWRRSEDLLSSFSLGNIRKSYRIQDDATKTLRLRCSRKCVWSNIVMLKERLTNARKSPQTSCLWFIHSFQNTAQSSSRYEFRMNHAFNIPENCEFCQKTLKALNFTDV